MKSKLINASKQIDLWYFKLQYSTKRWSDYKCVTFKDIEELKKLLGA